jgi:spore coat protein A
VNGKLWPFLTVEPRKYRFRILDASNARSYGLKLLDASNPSAAGPQFYQIGSDGGFLEDTAILNDPTDSDSPRLMLSPAERADVIIDFSQSAGKSFILSNNSVDPGDGEIPIPQLMLFKVATAVSEPDTSSLPMHLKKVNHLQEGTASLTRQIVLGQRPVPQAPMLWMNAKTWQDPITEKPAVGATEIWELVNTLPDAHPFHMHLVNFQILDRRSFDVNAYTSSGRVTYTDDAISPDSSEAGWKDMAVAPPGMVTRIIVQFGPYPGYYVYHCHILEHEDMDMMRPFEVVGP